MLVKSFIRCVFLEEIEKMTIQSERVYAYLGFNLVSQSIEFLGACLDSYPWDQKGLSAERFKLALLELFPNKYAEYTKGKFDLYSNLRCSLVHSSRPGNSIGLSERKHEIEKNLNDMHLKIQDGKLLLIYEDLFTDFQGACNKILLLIENKKIESEKVYNHVISVPSDENNIKNN